MEMVSATGIIDQKNITQKLTYAITGHMKKSSSISLLIISIICLLFTCFTISPEDSL